MKIVSQALNFPMTEAISSYLEDKMAHVRFPDKVISVKINLKENKTDFVATAGFDCLGKHIHVEANHADCYAAIDAMTDSLQEAIVRYKESHHAHLS